MPKVVHDGLRKLCPCGQRKWAKCHHAWQFSFHYEKREYRYSLDKIARNRSEKPPRLKVDALAWRDRLRSEIRNGTFIDPATPKASLEAPATALTFGDVTKVYRKRFVYTPTRRPGAAKMFEVLLNVLERASVPAANGTTIELRLKPIGEIVRADVEAIREGRRAELAAAHAARIAREHGQPLPEGIDAAVVKRIRRPGSKGGEAGINRLLARLRHVLSWAVIEGYINESPFKRGGITVVKLESKAENARTRRLQPGEEERLLKQADPLLMALIVATLHTGCRKGELLSLLWSQVRFDDVGTARWLDLPAGQTKTHKARVIPIGPRLRAVLEMRRNDPAGEPLAGDKHVFGNEVGERVTDIREQWMAACAGASIRDLHFHDLRREFACRLLESSASLHDVREFLGHANVSTTSTYLASTPVRLAKALERLDPEPPKKDNSPDSQVIRKNEDVQQEGPSAQLTVTH